MKKHLLLLFAFLPMGFVAANPPTRMVVSGSNGKTPRDFSLDSYNRISFTDRSLKVSSSIRPEMPDVEMLYDEFYHIEWDEKQLSELSEPSSTSASIGYNEQTRSLTITDNQNRKFTLGVFSIGGQLQLSANVEAGNDVFIRNVSSGVYIAIATCRDTKLYFKFVIK